MLELKQLYDKHYENIDSMEYKELLKDNKDGYILMLCDVELEELLNYFIDVRVEDMKNSLYDGTLQFYRYNNNYIAVLER